MELKKKEKKSSENKISPGNGHGDRKTIFQLFLFKKKPQGYQ